LVNAMCVGLLPRQRLQTARASAIGAHVVLYGATTGRDGIGGASVLASAELGEDDPDKRPTVQVGDPFTGKKLIETSLELVDGGVVAEIPATLLTDECPRYELESEPQRVDAAEPAPANFASKRPIYERYDHLVGSRTVRRPGLDAAVLRLRPSLRGLAVSLQGPPPGERDPFRAGAGRARPGRRGRARPLRLEGCPCALARARRVRRRRRAGAARGVRVERCRRRGRFARAGCRRPGAARLCPRRRRQARQAERR